MTAAEFAYQSEDELIEKTAPFLMEATGSAAQGKRPVLPHGRPRTTRLKTGTGRSSARLAPANGASSASISGTAEERPSQMLPEWAERTRFR